MYTNKHKLPIDVKIKYFSISKSNDDDEFTSNKNGLHSSLQKSEKCFYLSNESNYDISYDNKTQTFIHVDGNNKGLVTQYPLVNIFHFHEKDSDCYILQSKDHAKLMTFILQLSPFSYKVTDIWQHQPEVIMEFEYITRIHNVVKHLYQTHYNNPNKIVWLLYCLEKRNINNVWML